MQIMHNKKYLLLAVVFVLMMISFSIKASEDKNKIIAEVGGFKITEKQFAERYSDFLYSVGTKDNFISRKSILDNMINEILLKNFDDNQIILSDEEYSKELSWNKLQLILAFLKDQEVYARIEVSEEEMRTAFTRANAKMAARHLFAFTEEEANQLYDLLAIGVPFEKLARQSFSDTTLANNGGYIGYFTWGDLDPAFENAAFSLRVGEISRPVKTEYGYSIIKVEDIVMNPLLTEDEFLRKKSHLESVLKIRNRKSEEQKYLAAVYQADSLILNENSVSELFSALTSKRGEVESLNFSPNQLCAEYKGKKYSQSEFLNRISNIPAYHRLKINSTEILKTVIEGIIVQDILYSIAVEKGYDTDPLVIDRINRTSDYIFLKYKTGEILLETKADEDSVMKFYSDNPELFARPEQVNVQEIVVDNKQLADSLINLIRHGEDFGRLAESFSIRKWSAANKGILGLSTLDKFGLFKSDIQNTPAGNVVGPLNYQSIYAIFKIIEKIPEGVYGFSEVKENAESMYKSSNKSKIMQDYIAGIRKKVKINLYEEILRNLKI